MHNEMIAEREKAKAKELTNDDQQVGENQTLANLKFVLLIEKKYPMFY